MLSKIGSYTFLSEIGKGSFGIVYLTRSETNGLLYAVKIIQPDSPRRTEFVYNEIVALKKVQGCLGIINFKETLKKATRYYIVTDYIQGLNLGDWMIKIKNGDLRCSSEGLLLVMKRLSEIVARIQGYGLIHRDLKPGNIIIHPLTLQPTILDFGFACSVNQQLFGRVRAGSKEYSPPEMFQTSFHFTKNYSFYSIDVYSLGLLFYYLATGNKLRRKRRYNSPLQTGEKEMDDLIVQMIDRDHKKRPSIGEIINGLNKINHPSFSIDMIPAKKV